MSSDGASKSEEAATGAGTQAAQPPPPPAVDAAAVATLTKAMRVVPDYPKPGVTFKDFTPLLADGTLFRLCIEVLAARYRDSGVTHVASCEARGLALGAPLALTLGCGFVPLRKPRKLPCSTLGVNYGNGKGCTQNRLEVHADAFSGSKSPRVVIIDDVIASGKTMVAAVELVVLAGASVVECCVLADMPELHGSKRLHGKPLFVLLPDA